MPEIQLKEAITYAEEIRTTATTHMFGDKKSFSLTLSIGIAEIFDNEVGSDMIARADAALYRAKQSGRNRVEVSVAD